MYRVILKYIAALAASAFIVTQANSTEVYFFKGAGDFSFINENMHFSLGLNEMADILNAEGIRSEVRRFGAVEDALATIRTRKPESIALVGHSMGALASMALAKSLEGEGIKIVYMGLIDIPGPVGVAGDNVQWVENYYSANPVYGKLTNIASHPNAKNIHVTGYMHNRMDDSPEVKNGMLSAIRQVHAAEKQQRLEQQSHGLYVQNHQENTNSALSSHSTQTSEPIQAPINTGTYTPAPVSEGHLADAAPYALPSVSVPGNTQNGLQSGDPLLSGSAQDAQYQQPQSIDPVTTSSVENTTTIDRGRSLWHRASNFVRRLNDGRNERVNAFAPNPER